MNYSRQRQMIMDFLQTRRDHPTADTVYQNVRKKLPSISLGTVYRNLNQLAQLGQIRKVRGLCGSEHFDGDTSEHPHFICRSCGCVEDVVLHDASLNEVLKKDVRQGFSGIIEANDLCFRGLCSRCCKMQ